MKKPLLTVFCILVCGLISQAQIPSLLGEKEIVPDRYTPIYHIRYNSGGFDLPHTKKINKKTPSMMARHGVARLIPDFQANALEMSEEDMIPNWIDTAYTEISQKWRDCGGKFASIANSFNPNQFYIQIEEAPFWVDEYNGYVVGVNRYHFIQISNIAIDGLVSDPQTAYLRYFKAVVKWEIGNSFMLHGDLWNGRDEIGDNSPCDVR